MKRLLGYTLLRAALVLLGITTIVSASYAEPDWCMDEQREINNYPEYGSILDSGQLVRLRNIAAAIVRSHESGTPILAVKVIGHADRALRVPPEQRAAKEQQVSEQRAKHAKEQLVSSLATFPNGSGWASVIQDPIGAGATELKIKSPANEAEMRLNRRVVFRWSRCLMRPISPDPIPHNPSEDINDIPAGQHFKMKILDGVGASGGLGGLSFYTLLFWDVDNHRAAEYAYPALIQSIGIPPFSETGESDWSEVFTTTKFVQVDQLEGIGNHRIGSIGVASGMTFTFTTYVGVGGKADVYTGPSKSIGVEGGTGPLKLMRGTVHVFKGP